ncbi:MAG: amidohydrolase family protein [Balneola sp.]
MNRLPVLFLFYFFISCSSQKQADLILTDVSIVDVENGKIIKNQLVAISGNGIIATDDASNLGSYSSEQTIGLDGKFVMPGLWDNHIHFRGGNELIEANQNLLPLLLRFGITSVRDGGGDITPAIHEWNDRVQKGQLDGPRIFTPGPKLDGSRPAWEGSISVTNKEEVIQAIDSLKSINADFLKIYDGNLTKEAFYQIIEEAESGGLKTTGHMPLSTDLMEAVKLGLDGTEHLYYALKETSFIADSLTEAGVGYGMVTPLMNTYDPELALESYQKLGQSGFYVTPTLHVGKTLAELLITDHSEDSLLNYISPDIIETYQRRLNSAKRGGDSYTQTRSLWVTSFSNMVKPMYDSGVNILAGSDSGPFNSFTYPGQSLHKELELLVNAGLTPQEALITSVINGPKFFGLENEYGSIEAGKMADLLILEQNPLEDITNTSSVYNVVAGGKWYSENALNDLMNSIKNN